MGGLGHPEEGSGPRGGCTGAFPEEARLRFEELRGLAIGHCGPSRGMVSHLGDAGHPQAKDATTTGLPP